MEPKALQCRLRTLLIVLAMGPPVLAWGWREYAAYQRKAAYDEYIQAARVRALGWDEVDHRNTYRVGHR